jgi:hypothetical protein
MPVVGLTRFGAGRLGIMLLVLAWPVVTLASGLDLYFVLRSASSRWGLMPTLAAGGSAWPIAVVCGGIVGAVFICVAFAKQWQSGRVGAAVLCWTAVGVWTVRLLSDAVGEDPGLALIAAAVLAPHVWALRSLHSASRSQVSRVSAE